MTIDELMKEIERRIERIPEKEGVFDLDDITFDEAQATEIVSRLQDRSDLELTGLRFWTAGLGDAWIPFLDLARDQNLQSLDLGGIQTSDKGVEALAQAAPDWPQFQTLNLAFTQRRLKW